MILENILKWQQVRGMSREQKTALVQQYTKTANTRLRGLEKSGEDKRSRAYIQTTQNAYSLNYKNRFYQGKNYKSQADLDNTLKDVIKFLRDETSTVRGSKSKKAYIPRKIDNNYDSIDLQHRLSEKDVKRIERWGKYANKNMGELEERGLTNNAYKYAKFYTEKHGMRFPTDMSKMNDNERRSWAMKITDFLKMKTSTVQGYIEVRRQRVQSLRELGFELQDDEIDNFFEFLRDRQYDMLANQYSSEQIFESFLNLRTADKDSGKVPIKQIMKEYDEVLQGKYTLEKVAENHGKGMLFK